MKRLILIFCVTLFCSLIAGHTIAKESSQTIDPDSQLSLLKNTIHKTACENVKVQKSGLETGNPELPYLLQRGQHACLDKCTQEFNSCMSGAGDSADKKFRCGESRWMCTRGCDNQFAPQINSL